MRKLVFDIETVGEDFDSFDELTKNEFLKRITHEPGTPAYEKELQQIKDGLVFSPLTGLIVAIGVLDVEQDKGVVYFQAPNKEIEDFEEGNFTYKAMTEKDMLESFWQGAIKYDEFITFNGRGFDVPYIVARSGINRVRVNVDLMANRYLSPSWRGPKHVDLYDQLRYFGATRSGGSLHMWCRALGIATPKDGETKGSQVGDDFKAGKYEEIARYNAKDLVATRDLYKHWNSYLKP